MQWVGAEARNLFAQSPSRGRRAGGGAAGWRLSPSTAVTHVMKEVGVLALPARRPSANFLPAPDEGATRMWLSW
ncbi:hypothetical protein MANAM107_23240 [Actinomyces capricornis]|uniref:Uncharacterized protein n=1 Tax=Actinomyces capricornis TaxID=2755559 RepID=A0ABM7UPV4_9ACTO|nr:hypothetical protein MANAM107_23240 [Actinomyces capricornis]